MAEDDRAGRRTLVAAIVQRAQEAGLAGATVLRASDGFGWSRRHRSELNVDAGPQQPLIVDIIDDAENIERFLPILDEMMETGLVTIEKVRAIDYDAAHPGGS